MTFVRVSGLPMPQGSKTAVVRGTRAVLLEGRRGPARDAFACWRADVVEACRREGAEILDGPLDCHIAFWVPRPASIPKKRLLPDRKPDLDKLVRACFDAMTLGGLIADDARIVRLSASKQYADGENPPGCAIRVVAA